MFEGSLGGHYNASGPEVMCYTATLYSSNLKVNKTDAVKAHKVPSLNQN